MLLHQRKDKIYSELQYMNNKVYTKQQIPEMISNFYSYIFSWKMKEKWSSDMQ